MYVLDLVSGFREYLESLQQLSFFHYLDAQAVLVHNQLDPVNILVLLGTGAFFLAVGLFVFVRRDIAT
jgi:ABC-type transport system involved in multi-copper enzyme maturation permease subunit